MKTRSRFSPEVRERAVRMVWEHRADYGSGGEEASRRAGPAALAADERTRLKLLEREVKELRRANEILRKASAYFAMAELDRRPKGWWRSSKRIAMNTGSSRSATSCRSPRRRT